MIMFVQVEDATKALEATNGTALEKNGKILRVAYAKSVHGSGTGIAATSHSSNLAAAAIEAAAFSQQVLKHCFLPVSLFVLVAQALIINYLFQQHPVAFVENFHSFESSTPYALPLIFVFISMTVLDGLQRNTILMRDKPLESRPRELGKLSPRKGLPLHSLAMCGMTHLVITMMLLLDTTTMGIQVCSYLYFFICLNWLYGWVAAALISTSGICQAYSV